MSVQPFEDFRSIQISKDFVKMEFPGICILRRSLKVQISEEWVSMYSPGIGVCADL